MTRKEQIKEASQKEMMRHPNFHISAPAFRMGAEWADAHPYWVSVEEALPECNIQEMEQIKMSRVCVVLLKNGTTHIATLNQEYTLGEKDGEPYWFDEIRNWEGMWLNRLVTHWMPLPAPPTCSGKPNNLKGGEQ